MEQISIINRIIEAEKNAQAMTKEARSKRDNLSRLVEKQKEEIKKELYERADKRIQKVRLTEENLANEQIANLENELAGNMQKVENVFSDNRAQWIDELFNMITGDSQW